jgi:hypothetical protein
MTQVVEHLPSKSEALTSNPSTAKKGERIYFNLSEFKTPCD